MKKSFKWILTVMVVLAVALAAAGCGGQQPQNKSEKSNAGQASGQQHILVASDTAFAPFEFQDKNSGKYVGFDIDLINAIAKVNNWQVDIRSMNFDGIVPALESSSVDMSISAMTITDARKQKVDFSLPYYQSGQSIAVQASNNTIKNWNDLKGKKIGVQISTTGANEARKIPGAKITDYNTINEAFMALKNGNVDAVVNDYPVNAYFIKQGNNDVKLVGDLRTSEVYGIAVPKGKKDILAKTNSALETLKKNGEFAKIYKKWFGQAPPDFLPGEPPAKK